MRFLGAQQASKVSNPKSSRPEARQPAPSLYPQAPTLRRGLLVGLSLAALGLAAHRALSSPPGWPFGSASGKALLPSPQRRARSLFRMMFHVLASQAELVHQLKEEGVVKHRDVESALLAVDRGYFADGGIPARFTYQDSPLPIGYGETISAPHMHASCLELLREHLKPGARVLDVGSGSGYLTAAMGVMVRPGGRVIGIEKHPELTALSVSNVRACMPDLLDSGVIELRSGNVLGGAVEGEEPFDAIHVGAAAERLPEELVRKLRPGGRMVVPVGRQWEYQVMKMIDRDEHGVVHKRDLMYVRYVPLTEPEEGGAS